MQKSNIFPILLSIIFAVAVKASDPEVCGGLIEAEAGHVDNVGEYNSNLNGSTCVWIIKSLSKKYIDFSLTKLPKGSSAVLYIEDARPGQPPKIFKTLSDYDIGFITQIRSQILILILPLERTSDEFGFSWSTWRLIEADGIQRSANFGMSHHGENLWTEFLIPQRMTWALNINLEKNEQLTLNIETAFKTTNTEYPCQVAYFGLFEILPNGILREVISVCNRPMKIEAAGVIPNLLGFLYVNPTSDFPVGDASHENFVDLKWSTSSK